MSWDSLKPAWRERILKLTDCTESNTVYMDAVRDGLTELVDGAPPKKSGEFDGFDRFISALYGWSLNEKGSPIVPETRQELIDLIWKMFSGFLETEFMVIVIRFGLLNNKTNTLADTGIMIGCSKERVRQAEVKTLRKFAHWSRRKKITPYLSFVTQEEST